MVSFSKRSPWVVLVVALLTCPAAAFAQDATLSGTITDATGGVLPGVTVTAIHDESGNSFVAVTDGNGAFRLPLRIGLYRISAELAGFTTLTRTGLQMQVGQQASVSLQMTPSSLQETVTVTAEAPLIDLTTSTVSGNIDQRQVQDLPLNGRNWLDLTLLAPGNRSNAGGESPIPRSQVAFQINMDGQQVTNSVAGAGFGQPRYSRDAVAEFEFVSNRFDATQGRSMGVVVNAVSKSGTNRPAGTFSGYFRDDKLNATDHVLNRVPTYSNQQYSATFGGPIRRDRVHIFANYEYEREPQSYVFNNPLYPFFNMDLVGTRTQYTTGVKVDTQFTQQTRMAVRGTKYRQHIPGTVGGTGVHPSRSSKIDRHTSQVWTSFTQVLGSSTVNEIKGGYYDYHWDIDSLVDWAGGRFPNCPLKAPEDAHCGSVRYQVRGYDIGTATNHPQYIQQDTVQVRDDFSFSYTAKGRHDVRMGGEYLHHFFEFQWCSFCNGFLQATRGAAPAPDVLRATFPVWNDASTWNGFDALSSRSIRYRQSVGNFRLHNGRNVFGAWYQDDWRMGERMTLNLGLRWDADLGVMGEKIPVLPWRSGDEPYELSHFAPRLGYAYRLTDRAVLRGGYGIYFTQLENDAAHQSNLNAQTIIPEATYDGRANFASDPYNGPQPSHADATARLCSTALTPTCIRRDITSEIPAPKHELTYSHQASVGIQQQLGDLMAFEANVVFTGQRREEVGLNMNLRYDPATGDPVPFSIIASRPYPDWGFVDGEYMQGYSNYYGVETSFTRRFADRWQMAATYTFAGLRDSVGDPCQIEQTADGSPLCNEITFPLQRDIGGEYTLAATDQRHRAVVNGIWEMGMGFQVSGLYFYGSGMRTAVSCNCESLDTGSGGDTRRLDDGTFLERNSFVGEPIHRVDTRLQKRFVLGARMTVDGMLEVFNLFNRANFGSYTTNVHNANFGRPTYNSNVAYASRAAQLGFRVAF